MQTNPITDNLVEETDDTLKGIAEIKALAEDENCRIEVVFDHVEREFTETDHFYKLFSKVSYNCNEFHWESVLPTVRIPYKDPALGFLIDGAISSSIGIYSRAPGVIRSRRKGTGKDAERDTFVVEIVSDRNAVLNLEFRKKEIKITTRRRQSNRTLSLGPFLKAISGLPYEQILKQFKFRSPELVASLSPVDSKGQPNEPSFDQCISETFERLLGANVKTSDQVSEDKVSTHWKLNRIQAFLDSLHFKSNRIERLDLGNRVQGCVLAKDSYLPVFDLQGNPTMFGYSSGKFVDTAIAEEYNKYDVESLCVKASGRPFIVQTAGSMHFRCKGYKLAQDVADVDIPAGTVIGDRELALLDSSDKYSIEVIAPKFDESLGDFTQEYKTVWRTSEHPSLSDFINCINYLVTARYQDVNEDQTYNISNRIVVDYSHKVRQEVESVYSDIIDSLSRGYTENSPLQLPNLPSDALKREVTDRKNSEEVTQSELTNIMSRAISTNRASAFMESTPGGMQNIQSDQYGRIDSLHSPESDKVGSVQIMTVMSDLDDDTGEITTPVAVIKNGVATGDIVKLTATKEANRYIAGWDEDFSPNASPTEEVMVRFNGDVTTVPRKQVDYQDVSPYQDMSISRATIPFPEFSMPRRSLMATKMSGQAVPLLFPQRPRVGTGGETEVPCLYYKGRDILAAMDIPVEDGAILELVTTDWGSNMAEYTFSYGSRWFKFSLPSTPTDKETLYNYRVNYKDAGKYGLEDIVFYNQSCDIKPHKFWERMSQGRVPFVKNPQAPSMALGTNLRVCYKTFGSSTVDDAVVISDRLVKDMTLSSVELFKYEYEFRSGDNKDTVDFPELHSYVSAMQPVITVWSNTETIDLTKQSEINKSERYIGRARKVKAKEAGEVVSIKRKGNKVCVWVATYHNAEEGDKVAGRYGNKSVIARVCPEAQMPYDPETGEIMDICCSPLGIPSRMNLGQLLEVALGAVMSARDEYAVVSPFYKGIKSDIKTELEQQGIKPRRLFIPTYGKLSERPITVGVMYFLKLEQIANLKINAVGYPRAIDPVFGQPGSKASGAKGQAVSEMETWALIASGSKTILNAMCSLYSENDTARKSYFDALNSCNPNDWDESFNGLQTYAEDNKAALVTQLVYRMFGLEVTAHKNPDGSPSDHFDIDPLDMSHIRNVVTCEKLKMHSEAVGPSEWSKVKLKVQTINPFWIEAFPLGEVLGQPHLRKVLDGKALYDFHEHVVLADKVSMNEFGADRRTMTGIEAIIQIIKDTPIGKCIENISKSADSGNTAEPITTVYDDNGDPISIVTSASANSDLCTFLQKIEAAGWKDLSCLIWDYFPVMPKVFRQSTMLGGRGQTDHAFHSQLVAIASDSDMNELYSHIRAFIGYGKANSKELTSIRRYFFGKGAGQNEHGKVRSAVLSKHVGFSGRSVITPTRDIYRAPYFVGVPWRLAMVELATPLAIRVMRDMEHLEDALVKEGCAISHDTLTSLRQPDWETIIESLGQFNSYVLSNALPGAGREERKIFYYALRDVIRNYCEGNVSNDGKILVKGEWRLPEELDPNEQIDAAVFMVGRQPTLHKKSIRCYFIRLVEGYTLEMHPTVCSGYNADFDGDTMWNIAMLGDMKNESWKTESVLQDLISDKDGSYTIVLAQDSALGLYCATTFKGNASKPQYSLGQFYTFDNVESLRENVEFGELHYYDPVLFLSNGKRYLSTAGRVLVNCMIPGALTELPYTDKDHICRQVFGEDAFDIVAQGLCSLKYDCVFVATGIKAKGHEDTVKIENVLLDVYHSSERGERISVDTAQRLFEIGIIASDITSVSMGIEDTDATVSMDEFMAEPAKVVGQLNSLYAMGLISKDEQKMSSMAAWDEAKNKAKSAVIANLNENSNMFYCLYSGARGKPDQLMQAVGFIGHISKTRDTDIEYPILRGYGEGLSSLDLYQTCFSARIGVVSTQSGTKMTGYATRQSVNMTSGMEATGVDTCGIMADTEEVVYNDSLDSVKAVFRRKADPNGEEEVIESLSTLLQSQPRVRMSMADPAAREYRDDLDESGGVLTESVAHMMVDRMIRHIYLEGIGLVTFKYSIDPEWREEVKQYYSYTLPYTDGMKITDAALNWIEDYQIQAIPVFEESQLESKSYLDKQPYVEVEYDKSKYTCYRGADVVPNEYLLASRVDESSEGYHYYKNLLAEDGAMTLKALHYLTKKEVRSIKLKPSGEIVRIQYELSSLCRDFLLGKVAEPGTLPYLDDEDSCITKRTLDVIQNYQLKYVLAYTSLTCLSPKGICTQCYGKSPVTGKLVDVGTNLGIPASQAMCEPLSQATLNVTHSGGNRSAGTGLVSGLDYYLKLLQGKVVTKKNESKIERFAPYSGILTVHTEGQSRVISIEFSKSEKPWTYPLQDHDLVCSVPDGAYVDEGDTIVSGFADLNRYSYSSYRDDVKDRYDHNIFRVAAKTRYNLMKEYQHVFGALGVSPRNYEIMARAQTTICYHDPEFTGSPKPRQTDVAYEVKDGTGEYYLTVSSQDKTVLEYTGLAGYGFENISQMLVYNVLDGSVPVGSWLSNIITGTDMGSQEAKMTSVSYGKYNAGTRIPTVEVLSDLSLKNYTYEDYKRGQSLSLEDSLDAMLLEPARPVIGQQEPVIRIEQSNPVSEEDTLEGDLPPFEEDDGIIISTAREIEVEPEKKNSKLNTMDLD